ncbi:hypothetical protein J4E93_002210 [Alternaria ventricosa]|uniref:uncharacterized protein n=1 Tax=Alternaria ventricosa TaxID=1187951 RepID=UPI0020C1C458|nr:uncharacterized protein J4E93_002210 [Alternaria ventricosa]KAI4652013.1 hypothetical protein J4E93_002210 [Alternaria ventricosa]
MVRILSVAAVFFTIAFGAQASHICQCLFQDGSHCCASVNNFGAAEDCQVVCVDKKRNKDGVACNAGGKWSHVGGFTVQFREPCQ